MRSMKGWRADLLRAQALIEAGLDFADEGDVIADVSAKADPIVARLSAAIARHLSDRSGERLRDGLKVVIAGPPNAGKSSLLNALAKREAAIVSEEAGTTRDVIEVHLDLGGVPVMLIDTAGLREAEGKIEAEGIKRALARAGDADLLLWLVDATAPQWDAPPGLAPGKSENGGAAQITVVNKIDLAPEAREGKDCLEVSAKTGEGVGRLVETLAEEAALATESGASAPLLTRTRHRVELESAHAALERYGDPAARSRTQGRGVADRRPPSWAPHRPDRCRGSLTRHLRRVLHRQVRASVIHVKQLEAALTARPEPTRYGP